MKRYLGTLALVLVVGLILFPIEGKAHMGRGQGMGPGMMGPGMMGPGMMGPQGGYRGSYCPYCGGYLGPGGGYGMGPGMMGPGMMGPGMMGPGMMGPGMMGPGMMGPGMMGPGMMGPGYGPRYGPRYQQPQRPLEEKDVKVILENYLRSRRNPNLKLGKITEKDKYFEAEILTKDNSLADKIIVDKYSGWMRSIY